jgi:integrase
LCAIEPATILRGPFRPILDLRRSELPWTLFWQVVQRELRNARFRIGTLRVYRQVLRSFKAFLDSRSRPPDRPPPFPAPRDVTAEMAEEFIHHIVARQRSASWLATNICILRTAFDKLGGLCLTRRLVSPKRPDQLPDVLAPAEMRALIAAAPTPRDRLLIGFLYGCGLKVAELSALRWRDLDIAARLIHVVRRGIAPERRIHIPDPLLGILARGARECEPGAFVFPGRAKGRHLSERTAERTVARAARSAGLLKPVCCMTLRHSYAVARLRAGDNIRDIQESLGHHHIETTLQYRRYLATDGIPSPAERLQIAFPNSVPNVGAVSVPRSGTSLLSPRPQSTIDNPNSPVPSFDLQIDPNSVELPFPEIPGGWQAFLAWLKSRLPHSGSPHGTPPDTG